MKNKILNQFLQLYTQYGLLNGIIFVTFFAICVSVSVTLALCYLVSQPLLPFIISVSILAPLIVSPIASYPVFFLASQFEKSREEIRLLSITDELTQISNRRHFIRRLEEEICDNRKFSVMLIDVDYFKRINDAYGHLFGDDVLRQIARLLSESIRQDDLAARFGGEEFVIFLKDMPEDSAFIMAERIRRIIENHNFINETEIVKVTVSIGIITFSEDAPPVEKIFHYSDQALYKAKQNGRNQTQIAVAA